MWLSADLPVGYSISAFYKVLFTAAEESKFAEVLLSEKNVMGVSHTATLFLCPAIREDSTLH